MLPPPLVDATFDREPSEDDRARRDAVEGSKVTEEEFVTRSRPANAPARPTLPMRSKSTRGELASAAWAHIASRKAVIMRGEHDLHAIACWGGVSCTTRERRDKRVRYEARGQGVEWLLRDINVLATQRLLM